MYDWYTPDIKGFCLARYSETELENIGIRFDV